MFSVLVVDDDRTCLLLLKACLEKWNYQVTTVKHAQEALSMLRSKSYDLVLTDVHMPDINGFELLKQIDREFNLPVILISADTRAEVMCMGIKNGAQRFLVKPIEVNDMKNIWQYSVWWKATKKSSTSPVTQINESSQAYVTRDDYHNDYDNAINVGDTLSFITTSTADDYTTGRRNRRVVWTADLHNRFVEAILIIGYHRAVPTNILEVMNIPGLTRDQVASHLQKFHKFLQRVLDGSTHIEFSNWIDLNYYSSFVSGNPNILLINQLIEAQNNGKLAAHNPLRPPKQQNITVRAPNGSSSSGLYRPLPPFTKCEESSKKSENINLIPNSYSYSSVNAASMGLDNATLQNTYNENMGNIVERSTSNDIYNMSYKTNQMNYNNENNLAQGQNYSRNGGLIGEAINGIIPLADNVAPSSTALLCNSFYAQQLINVVEQGNKIFYYGNNVNADQLGSNHGDPNIGVSFNANHFGNTLAMNAQQLGGEQRTDESGFNNNGSNFNFK